MLADKKRFIELLESINGLIDLTESEINVMRTNPEFCYEILQENFGSNKAEKVTEYLFEFEVTNISKVQQMLHDVSNGNLNNPDKILMYLQSTANELGVDLNASKLNDINNEFIKGINEAGFDFGKIMEINGDLYNKVNEYMNDYNNILKDNPVNINKFNDDYLITGSEYEKYLQAFKQFDPKAAEVVEKMDKYLYNDFSKLYTNDEVLEDLKSVAYTAAAGIGLIFLGKVFDKKLQNQPVTENFKFYSTLYMKESSDVSGIVNKFQNLINTFGLPNSAIGIVFMIMGIALIAKAIAMFVAKHELYGSSIKDMLNI